MLSEPPNKFVSIPEDVAVEAVQLVEVEFL